MKKDNGHRFLSASTLETSSFPVLLSAAQSYCKMAGALPVLLPFVFYDFETPL